MIEVMLFLLSQNARPSWRDWYDAVDDSFGEFSEAEKYRMVDAGIDLMERRFNPTPVRRLRAA
ncbi:hypothetical protein U8607_17575 [Methylobacterium durans]|uniref:hypothetical protein n=1 Tax=Methylobacterium durans TaxID=2202825 RepID=UPI002AFE0330|nr:hypothetical protein [Methylobacterium durans]MEA1833900.1 hypothetical protein [Methylobacterium durans]